jgi:hypothetical protein
MSGSNFHGDRSRTFLPAGGLLIVLAALIWWRRGSPAAPAVDLPTRIVAGAELSPAAPLTEAAVAAVPTGVRSLPVAVLPGHEGHGDECAECFAERKLAVYREDYAQLQFSLALQGRVLPADQSAELQDACRRFSRAVLREWSFSDSKPRLPDDAAVENLRSEMLQPLIERLPPVLDDAP